MRRVNRKAFFTNSDKKDKKTWTELLVSYLPFLLGQIWLLLPVGYIFFGDTSTMIFSLLSEEQRGMLVYASFSLLIEVLALLPFFLIVHVGIFFLMSFIFTLNQNLTEELARLQK